jgi:multicomponent Na+:H+ antiporter subunit E
VRQTGQVVLLVALWLLAWGEITVANVISGVVVTVALLAVFPSRKRSDTNVELRAVGAVRLLAYIVAQLVRSNVVIAWEILRPRSTVRPGILAHRLQRPSEEVITVMTSVIALSPGTMTVDVDRDSTTVYVHFLLLRDVAAARASLVHLEELVVGAITAGDARSPSMSYANEESP